MLKNITRAQMVTETNYLLYFDDGHGNGYAFPCDENGTVDTDMPEAATSNYEFCRKHPDQFKRANQIKKVTCRYREEAHGTCDCGEKVYLVNEYYGACECDRCGKWYNLRGEEIQSPETWEEELEVEEW